jgi:hypothetical protein
VLLVELLTALKVEFLPNLEVSDEGGYWERRDVGELREKLQFLKRAIDTLSDALTNDSLSPEDPHILATRIERLAQKVHALVKRPAEHAPVQFPQDVGNPVSAAKNEACWDAQFEENRWKQERMQRVFEERTAQGSDLDAALDAALDEVVPQMNWLEDDEMDGEFVARLNEACEQTADEPWLESLPESVQNDDDDESFDAMERHPLQRQATGLLMEFHDLSEKLTDRSPNFESLMRNAGEVTGGLAQALPLPSPDRLDDDRAGLCLVQLKRALRGAAFVRGALFLVRENGILTPEEFTRLMNSTEAISAQILELLRTVRQSQLLGDDGL